MANCVLSNSIPVRVNGIFVNAPAFHGDIAPPANPNQTMEQCRDSCGIVGSCEPVGFERVRRETLENPTGGVQIPDKLNSPLNLSEDQCLDKCRSNKDCNAVLHNMAENGNDECYHLSNVSNHKVLKRGSGQLFLRRDGGKPI